MARKAAPAETPATSANSIVIQGIVFTTKLADYEVGHQITEGEAAALNQVRRENLRNNFAATVRAAKEAVATARGFIDEDKEPDVSQVTTDMLDMAALAAAFDEYAASYVFGVRTAGGPRLSADPVEKIAISIARPVVIKRLREKGFSPDQMDKAELHAIILKTLDANPNVREEARRRWNESQSLVVDV